MRHWQGTTPRQYVTTTAEAERVTTVGFQRVHRAAAETRGRPLHGGSDDEIEANGENGRAQTYALVLEKGDEAMRILERFPRDHGLTAAHFTGIGAFKEVTLGYFDWERKRYREITINDQDHEGARVGRSAAV